MHTLEFRLTHDTHILNILLAVLTTAVKMAQSKNLLKTNVSTADFKLAIFDMGSLDALLSNNQRVSSRVSFFPTIFMPMRNRSN
jgi:hypothetical protein